MLKMVRSQRNLDLTPAELSRIIMLIEAGGKMMDTLDQGIHRKVSKALEYVHTRSSDEGG